MTPRRLLLASILLPASLACMGLFVESRMVETFALEPGQVFAATAIIVNADAEPRAVRAYVTDYLFDASGSNRFDPPGSHARSCGEWVTFAPAEFVVAPRGRYDLPYEIRVPATGDLRGTYWCALQIEPFEREASDTTPDGTPTAERSLTVRSVVRHAIQLAVDLGGGHKNMSIVERSIRRDADGQALVLDIENTGETWVKPLVWVEVFGADGVKVARKEQQRGVLYPTCSLRQVFALDVGPGSYDALVIIDGGGDDVWGAQYEIEFPEP